MEVKTVIPFPLYNYRIYLIFTDSLVASADKLVKEGKLRANHGVDDTTDGFHVKMPNQSYSFVVLKFGASVNHIVHEVYHSISSMFDWIGAEHEEELFAYHMGYTCDLVVQDQKKAKLKLDKSKESV